MNPAELFSEFMPTPRFLKLPTLERGSCDILAVRGRPECPVPNIQQSELVSLPKTSSRQKYPAQIQGTAK